MNLDARINLAYDSSMIRETDLYPPVKQFFENQGYEVKSEVTACDVVACKPDAPTVVIELKVTFSLDLVLQGIERQKLADDVYLAVPRPETPAKRKNWRKRRRALKGLCQRLGLGLLVLDLDRAGAKQVEVVLDPAPYQPRKNSRKRTQLKKEFSARTGDPNTAGISKRKIITSYRQDALRLATALAGGASMKVADLKAATGIDRAGSILQKNHYGWFYRQARGIYSLTEYGEEALKHYADEITRLAE